MPNADQAAAAAKEIEEQWEAGKVRAAIAGVLRWLLEMAQEQRRLKARIVELEGRAGVED